MGISLRTRYVISTTAYAVCALGGFVGAVLSVLARSWLLAVICTAFFLVALDNVFCGDHCRLAGYSVQGHYTIPPFLRGKQ